MKLLIQATVFVVCYCLNAYLSPFFKDLGYAVGIYIAGDPDGASLVCGLFSGALAVLVYAPGFTIAKRINERRLAGKLRNAPGIKRTIFGLLMLLMDTAITGAAVPPYSYFGSGDFVVPASGGQLLYDLIFLSTWHWMGVLGIAALIWGLVAFCRRKPAPSKFTEEAPPAPVTVQPPTPSKPKARFCKLCGDPIDPATRKCSGCGKQYFRLPAFTDKHYFIAATAVACAVIAFLLAVLVLKNNQVAELSATISDLETRLGQAEDDIAAQERTIQGYERSDSNFRKEIATKTEAIEKLQAENSDMQKEIRFYDDHVVFVSDDGTRKYHNYSCPYLDLSHFWAYNTEAAKDEGYKPCSHCCG